MSDAVMKATEAEAAVIKWLSETEGYGLRMERLIGDLENEGDILPWLVAAYNLAASPSVGGWEDISTAPKDGTDIDLWCEGFGRVANARWGMETHNGFSDPIKGPGWVAEDCDVTGCFHDSLIDYVPTHWMPLPRPPSVSTGSRPQEAVPTEGHDAAVVAHMVQRFLSWRLPEDFNPDNGVSFKPTFNDHMEGGPMQCNPTGTNLFDARQAEAMVKHMLEGLPK